MTDVHQGLMDKAYDRWNGEWKGCGYDEFVNRLDHIERLAVLTGNFNYQVENGGFSQWFGNGYGKHVDTIISLLNQYKHLPGISRVIDLVCQAHTRYGGDEYVSDDFDDLDDLDTAYYAINETFMASMESILTELTNTRR